MEVGFVVFHDGLVDKHILDFGRYAVPFENQEYQRFQEILLLPEVLGILFFSHLERVHGNGFLLGIGYVSAFIIAADAFIGISGINHDHIGVLFQKLPHDRIHVELIFNDFYH